MKSISEIDGMFGILDHFKIEELDLSSDLPVHMSDKKKCLGCHCKCAPTGKC